MNRFLGILVASLAFAVASYGVCAQTLDQVKTRGQLLCGVNVGLGGFALPDAQGKWAGLEVDYCRAIAAAVFGDASKVKYVPLDGASRFEALKSGAVDVLIRSATWTLSRDTVQGHDFEAVYYYDGQGFMVRKSMKVQSALELD